MSRESGKNRGHAQLTLTSENLLLQLLVTLFPTCGQRATPSIDITCPKPHEVGRSREELIHILITETQLAVNTIPNGILSRHCQRHIDTVKSHVVNFKLPTIPVPPRRGVVEGAVVEVVTILIGGLLAHLLRHRRYGIGEFQVRSFQLYSQCA